MASDATGAGSGETPKADDLFSSAIERQVAEQRSLNDNLTELSAAVEAVKNELAGLSGNVEGVMDPLQERFEAFEASLRTLHIAEAGLRTETESRLTALTEQLASVRTDLADNIASEVSEATGPLRSLATDLEDLSDVLRADLREQLESATSPFEGLETAVAGIAGEIREAMTSELSTSREQIDSSVLAVRGRLEDTTLQLEQAIAEVTRRITEMREDVESSSTDEHFDRIQHAISELQADVQQTAERGAASGEQATETAREIAQSVSRLEEAIAGLQSQVQESQTSQIDAVREAFSTSIESVQDQLIELAGLHDLPTELSRGFDEQITDLANALADRIDELQAQSTKTGVDVAGRFDSAAQMLTSSLVGSIDALRDDTEQRLQQLAQQLAGDAGAADDIAALRSELTGVMTDFGGQIDMLAMRFAEAVGNTDANADGRYRALLDQLSEQTRILVEADQATRAQLAASLEQLQGVLGAGDDISRSRLISEFANILSTQTEQLGVRFDDRQAHLWEHTSSLAQESAESLSSWATESRESLTTIAGRIEDVLEAAQQRSDTALVASIEELRDAMDAANGQRDRMATEVREHVDERLLTVGQAFNEGIEQLHGDLAQGLDRVVTQLADDVDGRLDELRTAIQGYVNDGIVAEVDASVDRLGAELEDKFAALRGAISDQVSTGLSDGLQGAIEHLGGTLTEGLEGVRSQIDVGLGTGITEIGDRVDSDVDGRLTQMREALANRVSEAIDELGQRLDGNVGELRDRLDHNVGELADRLDSNVGELGQKLEHTVSQVQVEREGQTADTREHVDEALDMAVARIIGPDGLGRIVDGLTGQMEERLARLVEGIEQSMSNMMGGTQAQFDTISTKLGGVESSVGAVAAKADELVDSTEAVASRLPTILETELGEVRVRMVAEQEAVREQIAQLMADLQEDRQISRDQISSATEALSGVVDGGTQAHAKQLQTLQVALSTHRADLAEADAARSDQLTSAMHELQSAFTDATARVTGRLEATAQANDDRLSTTSDEIMSRFAEIDGKLESTLTSAIDSMQAETADTGQLVRSEIAQAVAAITRVSNDAAASTKSDVVAALGDHATLLRDETERQRGLLDAMAETTRQQHEQSLDAADQRFGRVVEAQQKAFAAVVEQLRTMSVNLAGELDEVDETLVAIRQDRATDLERLESVRDEMLAALRDRLETELSDLRGAVTTTVENLRVETKASIEGQNRRVEAASEHLTDALSSRLEAVEQASVSSFERMTMEMADKSTELFERVRAQFDVRLAEVAEATEAQTATSQQLTTEVTDLTKLIEIQSRDVAAQAQATGGIVGSLTELETEIKASLVDATQRARQDQAEALSRLQDVVTGAREQMADVVVNARTEMTDAAAMFSTAADHVAQRTDEFHEQMGGALSEVVAEARNAADDVIGAAKESTEGLITHMGSAMDDMQRRADAAAQESASNLLLAIEQLDTLASEVVSLRSELIGHLNERANHVDAERVLMVRDLSREVGKMLGRRDRKKLVGRLDAEARRRPSIDAGAMPPPSSGSPSFTRTAVAPAPAPTTDDVRIVTVDDKPAETIAGGVALAPAPRQGDPVELLTSVKGLGQTKAEMLLEEVGSLDAILAATPRELAEIKGVSLDLAKRIKRALS